MDTDDQESPEAYAAVISSRYNDYVIAVDEGGRIIRSKCGRGIRRFRHHYAAIDHLHDLAFKRRESLKRRIKKRFSK